MHDGSLLPLTTTLLDRGVVIKIFFSENSLKKFVIVCSSKHATRFDVSQVAADFVDVISDKAVDISTLSIDVLEYQHLPPNVYLDDLTKDVGLAQTFGKDFLMQDKSYVENIKNFISQERARFISYVLESMDVVHKSDKNLINASYLVRFLELPPQSESAEIISNKIKQDAVNKFFIIKDSDQYILPGLRQIGTTNSIISNKDISIINAVKALWYHEIEKQKENALIYIENILKQLLENTTDLSDVEKQEYLAQSHQYKEVIENINEDILNDCHNIKEVINVWPDILYPLPWFAYGN
jgi:hypothetical protein